jgi:hypothetical protein
MSRAANHVSPFGPGRFSFDITGKSRPHMGYVPMEFTFLSLGMSATLQFATTTTYAYGPVIDKVKVDSCLPMGTSSFFSST